MKKNNRQTCKDKLVKVANLMHSAYLQIKAENEKTQFDYCTDPELSDLSATIIRRSQMINQIIFQEKNTSKTYGIHLVNK